MSPSVGRCGILLCTRETKKNQVSIQIIVTVSMCTARVHLLWWLRVISNAFMTKMQQTYLGANLIGYLFGGPSMT
jgi:hypothetical protein